jgi:hypothetical protein
VVVPAAGGSLCGWEEPPQPGRTARIARDAPRTAEVRIARAYSGAVKKPRCCSTGFLFAGLPAASCPKR